MSRLLRLLHRVGPEAWISSTQGLESMGNPAPPSTVGWAASSTSSQESTAEALCSHWIDLHHSGFTFENILIIIHIKIIYILGPSNPTVEKYFSHIC